MSDDNVKHPSVLLDYFRRIGAEVLNFRRAMVKEHRGNYYVERTLIKVKSDGTLEVTGNKEHFPTKEEGEAIKAALAEMEFPRSIGATESSAKNLIETIIADHPDAKPDQFYMIRNRSAGKVDMIQQRINADDGTKYFLSHTLWSDGLWRKLEPEGALPFWKPREKRAVRIMIHEGAKAARYVDWMLNDRSPEAKVAREAHPWTEDLINYEHWGILGGAFAAHRADYAEIKREAPMEVCFSCDNDWPGRQALKDFSKNYSGTLKGIIYPAKLWPESWDMADAIPERFFKKGRYIGAGIKSMMIPATYATEVKPNPSGKGRPLTVLRDHFAQEWMHSITPEAFIHHDWPSDILSSGEFNSKVRPFSDVDDTSRLLLACSASKSRRLHYDPGLAPGFAGDMDGAFINTYCPSTIKPIEGDPAPFLDYMSMLIPGDEDRAHVLKWTATLIARPDVKIFYGLLLISEMQGVGKTTLGEKILTPIMGNGNVSFPSETDIVESQFNSWLAHKRLVVINEIYAGSSAKAYNKLKSVITDKRMTVNKKHMPTYDIDCWAHILACSNSKRALKLSSDDRRWLVPKVTEEKISASQPGYWVNFNNWLQHEGGLGIIMHWAREYLLDTGGPIPSGEGAPNTATKKEVVAESLSPGMSLVASLLDEIASLTSPDDEVFTTDQKLVEYIKMNLYNGHDNSKLERPGTIRKLAKDYGWFVGETKTRHWCPAGTIGTLISRNPGLAKRDPQSLREELAARARDGGEELRDFDLSTNNLDAIREAHGRNQSAF